MHTSRDQAQSKSGREVSLCRQRVTEYQAKEREEARRRKQVADEAERADRERAREDNERKARQEAERQRYERDRRDRDARRDRERRDEDARAAQAQRDEAARREQDEQARAAREQDRQKREREEAENARRDAEASAARWRAEQAQAEQRARAEEARRESDVKAQSLYLDLLEQLKGGKDTVVAAKEFLKNPFGEALEYAADRVASGLVDKSLDIAAPIGAEKHDATYDRIAAAADAARGQALGGNPFAEKISGLAMEGVNKIHRQTLGQVDDLARQMDQVGRDDGAGSTSSSPGYRPPPAPATRATDNPFERGAAPAPAPTTTTNARASTWQDSTTGRVYDVPAGHTLYRPSGGGELTVLPENRAARIADDDRMVNGQPRCSAQGRGRVLAECERRRRSGNPFAAK